MSWDLVHSFVGMPCHTAVPPRQTFRRTKRPPCPSVRGLGVGDAIAESLTEFLRGNGIDYPPADGGNRWLWCLGGPDLFRGPLDDEYTRDLEPHHCIDLQLYVCDEHGVVSLELYPYDLVEEWGGSGVDDPRKSTPVAVGGLEDVVGKVTELATQWLDEILIWPGSVPS